MGLLVLAIMSQIWLQLVTKIGYSQSAASWVITSNAAPRHLSTLINQEIVGFQISMGNAMFTSEMSGILLDFCYNLKEAGEFYLSMGIYHELLNHLIFGLEILGFMLGPVFFGG